MMNPVARVIQCPPEVPLHLQRIELEIIYRPQAVTDGMPEDRAAQMGEIIENLTGLLQAGFLCRPAGPDDTARVSLQQTAPDRLVFSYAGRGVHVNLIVVLLRLILAYHQTPEGMEEELRATAEDPDRVHEYFTPMVFADLISAIVARQLVAVPGAPLVAPPDGSGVVSDDMPVPASGPLTTDPVVEAETVRLVAAVPPPDDALEDNWLTIAQFAAFLPPGHEPGFEPGEEQFMPRKKGKVLEIGAISVEQPFLFELLNLLAGGRLGEYRIEAS